MMHLPVVTHETALGAACEIIRAEIEGDEGSSVLMNWVAAVQAENPEVAKAVAVMLSDAEHSVKVAGLIGMAITYNALKAQAEVEALERLAG